MTKEEKAQRLLSNFDLRLSWLFSLDNIRLETTEDGIRYYVTDAKNGNFTLHVRKVLKHGTPPCLDGLEHVSNMQSWRVNGSKYINVQIRRESL